jgi:hypothetical protein
MVMGAPLTYKPEFCQRVIELGREGKSLVQIASALDCHKTTLLEWEKRFEDFSHAMARARMESQVWWENMGQSGLTADKFRDPLWAKQVSCRFPHDYREQSQTNLQHLDKNGQPADPPSLTDAAIIERFIQQKIKDQK